ncbi:alpha/beta hydrolase [Aeromicrobium sp.]|uniref:alpha/beta hydrolase n=1 Tax=Aeromicrobium sp. TaxID=1871063 RepID=UPI0030C42C51
MTLIDLPVEMPDCTYTTAGRSVVSGVRACATVISDVAGTMHANAAPAGIEGEPAEVAQHAMTETAGQVDAAAAAMITGLTALDAYCDRMDELKSTWHDLENMKGALDISVTSLRSRQNSSEPVDATLDTDIRAHNSKVATYDTDVSTWTSDVTAAENRVIAALGRADTVLEAEGLVGSVPDVPTLLQELDELGKDPFAINTWWLALSAAEREALKVSDPSIIGNTDGIPIQDRDDANRAHLSALLNTLAQMKDDGETLSEDQQELYDQAQSVYDGLDQAKDEYDLNGDPIPAYLMLYDPYAADGDGYGAIAFGNPETADHVSVNVPGFGNKLTGIDGLAGSAFDVRETAERHGNGTVASIAWMGYDAPEFDSSVNGVVDGLGVAGEYKAEAGARNLESFVDGLRATRQGEDPHMTVIGHSYGSTTVGKAAGQDGTLDVDDIVLVGSPGAGEENPHASDLRGNVYVGSAGDDFVSRLGSTGDVSLGTDPASAGFGGTRFEVDTPGDFAFDDWDTNLDIHTSYFDRDSSSLANVGMVVANDGGDVDEVDHRQAPNSVWYAQEAAEDGWRATEAGYEAVEDGVKDWFKNRFGLG